MLKQQELDDMASGDDEETIERLYAHMVAVGAISREEAEEMAAAPERRMAS